MKLRIKEATRYNDSTPEHSAKISRWLRRAIGGAAASAVFIGGGLSLPPSTSAASDTENTAATTSNDKVTWNKDLCDEGSQYIPYGTNAANYLTDHPEQLQEKPLSSITDALAKLACTPTATFIYKPRPDKADGYDIGSGIKGLITDAAAQKQTAVLALYEIPNRDLGGASAGGAKTSKQYRADIDAYAKDFKQSKADIDIIVEPDALPDVARMPEDQRAGRLADLRYAMQKLSPIPGVDAYLDAGNEEYQSADTIADLALEVGVGTDPLIDQKLAFNTSNTFPNYKMGKYNGEIPYANNVLQKIALRLVKDAPLKLRTFNPSITIDTSRNGAGHTVSQNQPAEVTAAGAYPGTLGIRGLPSHYPFVSVTNNYVNYPGGVDKEETRGGKTYYAGEWIMEDAVAEVNNPKSGLKNIHNYTLPTSK